MKLKSRLKSSLRLYFSGFMMGSADTVPGVSGGTIAFLLGIYEELIQSIKIVSGEVLKLALQLKVKEAWRAIPFGFLIPLMLGIFSAIIVLADGISYLLKTQPAYLWSFFFGLVVASVLMVRKRVVTWNRHDYLALGLGAVFAYVLVGAVPVSTPETLVALFLSGAVAICAMILPGISGSFLLVIMGKYEQVLNAVTERNFLVLFVFMAGAVFGLALFARVLSWLFAKHHDIVVAALTGFMIGSLRKVWPWKEVLETRLNSHGELVPLVERNIIPVLDGSTLLAVIIALVGFGLIILLDKAQVTKEQVKDIQDPVFARDHKVSLESQKSGKI